MKVNVIRRFPNGKFYLLNLQDIPEIPTTDIVNGIDYEKIFQLSVEGKTRPESDDIVRFVDLLSQNKDLFTKIKKEILYISDEENNRCQVLVFCNVKEKEDEN